MTKVCLGRTGIEVHKDGFGALPIQRAADEQAKIILQKALNGGINFFDTARSYMDSEDKIGNALSLNRSQVILATKTMAENAADFWNDLETSLKKLKTDYIDLYQFHNPATLYRPGDGSDMYEAMLEAKKGGKIRFIGITNHRPHIALQALESGLYDTLQFPFNYLSGDKEIAIVNKAQKQNIGFIAMKGLSGGLLTDIAAARSFMLSFPNVVPVWGIQKEEELVLLLKSIKENKILTDEQKKRIETDRKELQGNFCRGCGYCLPCPVGIQINMCARIGLLLKRFPVSQYTTKEWQDEMLKVKKCLHCGSCIGKCPYDLDTPALLQKNSRDYEEFLRNYTSAN
jgi:predicted aldo/keto reductase-like oxidoreductase